MTSPSGPTPMPTPTPTPTPAVETAPARSAEQPARAGSRADSLLGLQQRLGNRGVTAMVQRDGDSTNHLAQLDEWLDAFNTPEGQVISLMTQLRDDERRAVLARYRDRIANALNTEEMVRCVRNLRAPLPTALSWVAVAAGGPGSLDYEDIRPLVTSAPQPERNQLRTGGWQTWFTHVCVNRNIVQALYDLDFGLPTQLRWINAEADSYNITFESVRLLISQASDAERREVAGRAWRPFWTGVATNATMQQLVRLLFPDDLRSRLEWMLDEGTSLRAVRDEVADVTDPARRLAVFASDEVRSGMVGLCNDREMVDFVFSLGGDYRQWRRWVAAEGAPYRLLFAQMVFQDKVTEAIPRAFLRVMGEGANAQGAYNHVRGLSDADLATLNAYRDVRTMVNDNYGSGASMVTRALDGEIASGTEDVELSETLYSGNPAAGPFTAGVFGGPHEFDVTYHRNQVTVTAGVELEAADDTAAQKLPSAKVTWKNRIENAWNGKFRLQNSNRTVPLRFVVDFSGDGANHVNAHSGPWVWPNLNAGNWFVPEPVAQPQQLTAVTDAPIHEYGHLIGNLDEYSVDASHYIRVVGTNPATDPNALAETDTEGRTRYTNQVSLMGAGTTVLARHCGRVLQWVNAHRQPGEPPFAVI